MPPKRKRKLCRYVRKRAKNQKMSLSCSAASPTHPQGGTDDMSCDGTSRNSSTQKPNVIATSTAATSSSHECNPIFCSITSRAASQNYTRSQLASELKQVYSEKTSLESNLDAANKKLERAHKKIASLTETIKASKASKRESKQMSKSYEDSAKSWEKQHQILEKENETDRDSSKQQHLLPTINESLIGFNIEYCFSYDDEDGSQYLSWVDGHVKKIVNEKSRVVEIEWNKKKVIEGDATVTRQKLGIRRWNPTNPTEGAWREYFGDPNA